MHDILLHKVSIEFDFDSIKTYEYSKNIISNTISDDLKYAFNSIAESSRIDKKKNFLINQIIIELPSFNINELHLIRDYFKYALNSYFTDLIIEDKLKNVERTFYDFVLEYNLNNSVPKWYKKISKPNFLAENKLILNEKQKLDLINIFTKDYNFFKKISSYFSHEFFLKIIENISDLKNFRFNDIFKVEKFFFQIFQKSYDNNQELHLTFKALKKSFKLYEDNLKGKDYQLQDLFLFNELSDDIFFNKHQKIGKFFRNYFHEKNNKIEIIKKSSDEFVFNSDLSKLLFLLNKKSRYRITVDDFKFKIFNEISFFKKILLTIKNDDEAHYLLSNISLQEIFNNIFFKILKELEIDYLAIENTFISNNSLFSVTNFSNLKIKSLLRYRLIKILSNSVNFNKLDFFQDVITEFLKDEKVFDKQVFKKFNSDVLDHDYHQVIKSLITPYPFENISLKTAEIIYNINSLELKLKNKSNQNLINKKLDNDSDLLKSIEYLLKSNDSLAVFRLVEIFKENNVFFKKFVESNKDKIIHLIAFLSNNNSLFPQKKNLKLISSAEILKFLYSFKNNKSVKIIDYDSKLDKNQFFSDFNKLSYYIEFGSLPYTYSKLKINQLLKIFLDYILSDKLIVKKYLYNWSKFDHKLNRFLSVVFNDKDSNVDLDMVYKNILNVLNFQLFKTIRFVYDALMKYNLLSDHSKIFANYRNTLHQLLKKWPEYKFIIQNPLEFIVFAIKDEFVDKNKLININVNTLKNDFSNEKEKELFVNLISIIKEQIIDEKFKIFSDKDLSKKQDLLDGIVISNSGLVLFWPFLKTLFQKMNLLDKENNQFINDICMTKAILSTDYIVNGNTSSEKDFILNKILCGIEIDWNLEVDVKLNELEINICDEAMNAVINHWKKVKSHQTLRDWFLNREGIIRFSDETYTLDVQKKPYDVFLKNIKWGFSNIKYSLMNNRLVVNWEY